MWKRAVLVVVLAVLMTSCTMYSKPASGWSGATGGEKLEQLFWNDVNAKDFRAVESHLGPSFVGTGPNGKMDRAAFLQQLHSSQMTAASLSECASNLNGEDVMITCTLQREGASPNRSATLSVWQQYKRGWLMVAHSESTITQ